MEDFRNVAIRHGHFGLARELQEQNIVRRYIELYGTEIESSGNPLCFALSKGHFEMVPPLITTGNVNQPDVTGTRTPLLIAIEKCHLPTVRYLLENGADIKSSCLRGITPLHLASKIGYLPMVKFLIARGANVNERIGDKITPLYLASSSNHLSVVQYLVKHHADIRGADIEVASNDNLKKFLQDTCLGSRAQT
jgi:ankyrin repeat protein